jgi:hypothetical protein
MLPACLRCPLINPPWHDKKNLQNPGNEKQENQKSAKTADFIELSKTQRNKQI